MLARSIAFVLLFLSGASGLGCGIAHGRRVLPPLEVHARTTAAVASSTDPIQAVMPRSYDQAEILAVLASGDPASLQDRGMRVANALGPREFVVNFPAQVTSFVVMLPFRRSRKSLEARMLFLKLDTTVYRIRIRGTKPTVDAAALHALRELLDRHLDGVGAGEQPDGEHPANQRRQLENARERALDAFSREVAWKRARDVRVLHVTRSAKLDRVALEFIEPSRD